MIRLHIDHIHAAVVVAFVLINHDQLCEVSVELKQWMHAQDCSFASTMTSTIFYIVLVILLHKSFTSLIVGKTVYYIKSSMYTPCSEKSCLTLLQFAARTKNYLESNISLIFLPGYHNLDSDLSINAVSKLSMHSNLTLFSATPTIACEEQASITFSSINDVYIGHLTFIGCHSNQVTSVKTIILENATFINHTGSALQLLSSYAFVIRCSFISNSGGSYRRRPVKVTEDDYLFPNRGAYIKAGAAITLRNSSADISDCVFIGNHAQMGGAIFIELHSNIRLINTVFEQNHIMCGIGGGSICIGGALYSANGTVLAYNSTFFDNKFSIRGEKRYHLFPYGGVFGLFDSIFTAENCNFTHNGPDHFSAESESGYGGVIHAYNSTMNVTSSNFVSNTNASYGGAISISSAICIITHSNFTRNTCSANGRGGAIHSEKSSVTISSSEFKYNSLNSTLMINGLIGGVLFIYVHRKQANNMEYTYRVMNSVFEDNKGSHGGVIAVEGDVYLDIISCNFSRNHVTTSGGVMYIDSVGVVTILITSSLLNDNSAELFGGGIAISNDDAASNITLNGTQLLRNIASQGGAIFLQWGIQMVINNSTFVENAAEYGGAIICTSDTNITIEGGMIDKNTAHIGVVFVVDESSIDIFGTVISNNTANRAVVYIIQSVGYLSDITLTDNTGSIFVYFANLTLSGTVIIANGSSQFNSNKTVIFEEEGALIIFPEGGAVTAVQANVAIEGMCTLRNNYAENGGAFYATESRIHIYGTATIDNNVASNSGGGIYLHQSGLMCYGQCVLELMNNTSGYKGGGIYTTGSSISAENQGQITFRENDADFAGGGICIEKTSKLHVLMTTDTIVERDILTFLNNSADYGGAVYVSDETNSGTCASESYQIYSTKTECFLQVLSLQSEYFGVNNIGIMLFIDNQ